VSGTYYTALDLVGGNPFNFDDGTRGTIDVDWPDAIEAVGGAENIFSYKDVSTSLGYAGVKYREAYNKAGGVVYLAFPIESVYDNEERKELIEMVLSGFDVTPLVGDGSINPNEFVLFQNYPNPFNPSTTIKYSIPLVGTSRGVSPHVILKIFDILGREVVTLVNKEQSAGNYEIQFDASELTSGSYFYRITSGEFSESKKMILLR